MVNGSWKVATHLKTMACVQPAAGHHANSQRTISYTFTSIDQLVADFLNDVKVWRNEHSDH